MNKIPAPTKRGAFAPLNNWPITGKLLLIVLVPLSLIIVVTLILTITQLNRLEAETSDTQLREAVTIVRQQFAELEANLVLNVAQLIGDSNVLGAIQRGDRQTLQGFLLSTSFRYDLNHIEVVDADGQSLVANRTFEMDGTPPELKKLHNLGLLQADATALIPTPSGWLLAAVRPIKLQSGEVIGALSIGRLLNNTTLFTLNFERTNPLVVIFDTEGKIINVSETETSSDLAASFQVNHEDWLRAVNGENWFTQANVRGEVQRVAYAPLLIRDQIVAVVGVAFSTAATTDLRNQLITTNLIVVGIVTLLAILGAIGLGQNFIVRPIVTLAGGAKQIAAGNLDVVMPGSANRDELGMLANTFNSMAAQLRETLTVLEQRVAERTRALETSAVVSRSLSTILDEKQLVAAVVEQVRTAFNYYYAHIYLFDTTGETLLMAGGTGEAGQTMLARSHSIPKGKGLVGRAAETNRPVLIPDVSQDSGWLPNPLLPETKAEVAVPIAIGERVLGVLDVQHNVAGGLGQTEAQLIQSIANQVAIALQNARLYHQTQQQAEQEALINTIGKKIQRAATIESVLQTAVRELGQALGSQRASIQVSRINSQEQRKN